MKAILNDQREIGEMIGTLGQLFRIHTKMSKDIVSLEQELQHIRLYIKVQQMRFGDKIQYSEQLAPHTESLQVVHFSLQPLIENAIIHGLERRVGPGLLEVCAEQNENHLLITVRDNGAGMSAEQLVVLQRRLAEQTESGDDNHIGLVNVQERIHLYFGTHYGMNIDVALASARRSRSGCRRCRVVHNVF